MAHFKRIILFLICLVILSAGGSRVFAAYTSDDTFNYYANNNWYDKDYQPLCVSNTTSAGATTTSKGNAATAYNFLVGKGLSALAASAVVGNFEAESTPKVLPTITNGDAYGIAQWTSVGNRKQDLQKLANYQTLTVQLNYFWTDLTTKYQDAYKLLKSPDTTDPGKLALEYGMIYEVYDHVAGRDTDARNIFQQYGTGATTGLSSSCTTQGNGSFVYYSQTDAQWATKPYGSGTIGADGCGPTSLAMIVATFFDSSVTPVTMANLGAKEGSYDPKSGTIHDKLFAAAAKQYNFTYTNMTGDSMAQLEDFVKQGGLIYLAGASPDAPFTKGGHVVVMRGVTSDGQIVVADPWRNEADTYKPSVISAGKGTTYGIMKT